MSLGPICAALLLAAPAPPADPPARDAGVRGATAQSAPPAPRAAAPAAATAAVSPREAELLGVAVEAQARGEPGAEDAARALEQAAALSRAPAALLVRAARLRRSLADLSSDRAAAQRGGAAGPLLDSAARQAQSCADDARRAWQRLAPEAAAASQQGKPPAETAALVPAAGAEPLYLDAVCTGVWARALGVTPLLERGAELRALLQRAAQLAPALDEAGPDRELGRLFASLPAYAGGDVEAARAHFEKALHAAPSLRTRVAYAEGVGIKLQDRALFDQQLRPAPPAEDQSAVADRARSLLQRSDELFGRAH